MLFLTNEPAKKAEINILTARYNIRGYNRDWVLVRGTMALTLEGPWAWALVPTQISCPFFFPSGFFWVGFYWLPDLFQFQLCQFPVFFPTVPEPLFRWWHKSSLTQSDWQCYRSLARVVCHLFTRPSRALALSGSLTGNWPTCLVGYISEDDSQFFRRLASAPTVLARVLLYFLSLTGTKPARLRMPVEIDQL